MNCISVFVLHANNQQASVLLDKQIQTLANQLNTGFYQAFGLFIKSTDYTLFEIGFYWFRNVAIGSEPYKRRHLKIGLEYGSKQRLLTNMLQSKRPFSLSMSYRFSILLRFSPSRKRSLKISVELLCEIFKKSKFDPFEKS
jgi:hypothetical protein